MCPTDVGLKINPSKCVRKVPAWRPPCGAWHVNGPREQTWASQDREGPKPLLLMVLAGRPPQGRTTWSSRQVTKHLGCRQGGPQGTRPSRHTV